MHNKRDQQLIENIKTLYPGASDDFILTNQFT